MMTTWYEVKKYCQFLSTICPSCIGKKGLSYDVTKLASETSSYVNISNQLKKSNLEIRLPLIKLLLVLENRIKLLLNDYELFLQPMFRDNNTLLAVCARYEFYKTICIIDRLTCAISNFLQNDDLTNKHSSICYFVQTLLPHKAIYHNHFKEPLVISECLNFLYEFAFYEYVHNLAFPHNVSYNLKRFDVEINRNTENKILSSIYETTIIFNNPMLNNMLKWVAELFSYPVVPPNIAGNLISTTDKRHEILDLLTPTMDSKYHHKSILDPVVCFNCKFFNLSIGQTDDTEQRDYLKCNCIFKDADREKNEELNTEEPSLLDNLSVLNARTILNLIFILNNKQNQDGEFGCMCPDHQHLFRTYVEDSYKLLTKLQILQQIN